MKTKLHSFIFILYSSFLVNAQTQIGSNIIFSQADANFGQVAAINNSGDFIISSASYLFSNDEKGIARIYNFQNNSWQQVGTDIEGNANGDTFGASVAMNDIGNIVAVGATQISDGNNTGPGYVKVFEFSSGQYIQIGNDIIGEALGDNFGRSISINADGTKLIIGALFNDANTGNSFASVGHIRMYNFDGSNWNLMGSEIDGINTNDNFGDSVDINADGNRIVVSASGFDGSGVNRGLVRVYEFDGNNWNQLGQDITGDTDSDRLFNVSINNIGNRIAFKKGNTVNVFEYDGSQWSIIGNPITGLNNDILTSNLDNSGDVLTVASRIANNGTGYVQLYEYNNVDWIQKGSTLNGNNIGDNFGSSVEVKSGFMVVSSSDFNVNTPNNGGIATYDFNNLLSISENELDSKLKVFPNPSKDNINIRGVVVKELYLYDLNSRQIKHSLYQSMSVKDLENGVYLLKITGINDRVTQRKIIVFH